MDYLKNFKDKKKINHKARINLKKLIKMNYSKQNNGMQ